MKIRILLLAIIAAFFSATVSAQSPVLTGSNTNFTAGEQFVVHTTNISSLSQGPAGANQTWDFSSATSAGSITFDIVAPSSTPYAADFPNATIASSSSAGAYGFEIMNSSVGQRVGVVSSIGTKITYTDYEDYYRFPMSLNTTYVDPFACNFVSGVPFHRAGTITVTADAYGTIILPFGTINNVLRVKFEQAYTDSSQFGIITYSTEGYNWFLPGTHHPIYHQSVVYIDGTPSYFSNYLDQTSVHRAPEAIIESSVELFPNPATDQASISFNTAIPGEFSLQVSDLTGHEVMQLAPRRFAAGANKIDIDVSALASGMYLVTIEGRTGRYTKKLNVR